MDEAVERVIEAKYGADGTAYGNAEVFASSYRDPAGRQGPTPDRGTRFTPQQVQYIKDACNYVYETYGRFPAHVDAFYLTGHVAAVLAPRDGVLRPVLRPRAVHPAGRPRRPLAPLSLHGAQGRP